MITYCGITIASDNFSGQTVYITFNPCSGGTIDLGSQVIPYTYVTDYWYGDYECYSAAYDYTYIVSVPCPVTPTPTVTSTPTPTPAVVFQYNLWTQGVVEDACDYALGPNPSNITIYSTKTWGTIIFGDYVYGDNMLTIPPVITTDMISDGSIWIQIDIYTGLVLDSGICP